MAKQGQYNQGVQKIQNYVDRVAGLEIAKPQHKEYLQSKLDELGNRLKTVAAGDFSNQQLVNSVSGMTGQIVKDPIVQTAVYSTQVLKKGESDREIATKAGKTSPANDDLWNDTKSAWFNNADLSTPFDGKFIERWDVDKKLVERAEKILKNPDTLTQEQPYKHDGKGNTLYYGTEPVKDKDGKAVIDPETKQPVLRQTTSLDPSKGLPQYDEAMLRISVKGVSAEKLYNNFLDSLDSKDAQQLKIDARYKYKNATAETFAPDIIKTYDARKKMQSQEIVNLAVALNNPDLSSDQKLVYNARLTDLQKMEKEGILDKELNSVLENLKNPSVLEGYKENIYTQQHLISMAEDMSFKSYEQEIKNNPYMQMFMEKQRYNLSVIEFNDASKYRGLNYDLANNKFLWDQFTWGKDFEFKVDKEKNDRLERNPPPIITTSVLPNTAVPKTVLGQKIIMNEKFEQIDALKNQFAGTLFPGITDTAKLKESYDGLLKEYDLNPKANYTPDQKEFFKGYATLKQQFMTEGKIAEGAVASTDAKRKELMKGYNIPAAGGFSGEDILKAETAMQEVGVKFGVGFGGASYQDAVNYFTVNGMKNLLPILEAKNNNQLWKSGNPKETAIISSLNLAAEPAKKIASQTRQFTTDYLAKNTPRKIAQDMALDMNDPKTKSAVNKLLTTIQLDENAIGAGDASKVLSMQSGEKGNNMKGLIRKLEDGTTQAIFISPDGSETITLPMNYDKQQFFPEVRDTDPYNGWKTSVDKSPNKTTDILDARSGNDINFAQFVSAPITGYDLPGFANETMAPLVRFNIEGDLRNNGTATDKYSLNMFISDYNGKIRARRLTPEYIQWGGIQNILNNVGKPAYVEAIKTWKK
jgi:hypothetical protein